MAQVHWNNGSGGNWFTGPDWTGNAGNPPGTGDDVVIDANGVYIVTLTSGATVSSLQMAAKETLSITSGTLVLTNGSGSGSDAGTIAIGNNTELDFGGTLNNTSTISLNSVGNNTNLGGQCCIGPRSPEPARILLSDNAANRIYGAAGADVLVNAGNTITGSGQLGVGQLAFTNQSKGVVKRRRHRRCADGQYDEFPEPGIAGGHRHGRAGPRQRDHQHRNHPVEGCRRAMSI